MTHRGMQQPSGCQVRGDHRVGVMGNQLQGGAVPLSSGFSKPDRNGRKKTIRKAHKEVLQKIHTLRKKEPGWLKRWAQETQYPFTQGESHPLGETPWRVTFIAKPLIPVKKVAEGEHELTHG